MRQCLQRISIIHNTYHGCCSLRFVDVYEGIEYFRPLEQVPRNRYLQDTLVCVPGVPNGVYA